MAETAEIATQVHAEIPPQNRKKNNAPHRILILGGGFGGIYTAKHLDHRLAHRDDVEITLVSQDNYFLMTPFLFEAGSGILEPRHAVNPIRLMFKKARYVQATIDKVDFEARKVLAHHSVPPGQHGGEEHELPYDQLVLALGGVTNRGIIPGSEHALTFKSLGDAIFLRNRIIDLFERADVEEDEHLRRKLLTIVIAGGGLVGIELLGELTEFVENLKRHYPRLQREMVQFYLVEATARILPEMPEELAAYAARVLQKRGVILITGTRVESIEVGKVHLPPAPSHPPGPNGTSNHAVYPTTIEAETILLTAGVSANPLLAAFPLTKGHNGRIPVANTMRSNERPEVWAIGDCALIPDQQGKPYPPLAQHALREARVLARNIAAVVNARGQNVPLEPFVYKTLGMLASLGHYNGVGTVMGIKIRGFFAWWVWRTYYVFQMPGFERKLRVILDWTVALFFRNDIVKLDLYGEQRPREPG